MYPSNYFVVTRIYDLQYARHPVTSCNASILRYPYEYTAAKVCAVQHSRMILLTDFILFIYFADGGKTQTILLHRENETEINCEKQSYPSGHTII